MPSRRNSTTSGRTPQTRPCRAMPSRLSEIEDKLDRRALVRTCEGDNCSLSLKGLERPFLMVSLDREGSPIKVQRTRCDYLFFSEDSTSTYVVPIELKSGSFDPDKAMKQLQAGSSASEALCPSDGDVRFFAVLAHGRLLRKAERKRITVRFRGTSHPVRLEKCGALMKNVLNLAPRFPAKRRMPRGR